MRVDCYPLPYSVHDDVQAERPRDGNVSVLRQSAIVAPLLTDRPLAFWGRVVAASRALELELEKVTLKCAQHLPLKVHLDPLLDLRLWTGVKLRFREGDLLGRRKQNDRRKNHRL